MIDTVLYTVASAADHAHAHEEEAGSSDILGALGIDVQLLVFQLIAFLILVFVLGKWILPTFIKIVDEREAKIESGIKAAQAAEDKAASANDDIDMLLKKARKEARDIVTTAKDEANAMVTAADEKAKANAEHMLQSARDDIEKEVLAARRMLKTETLDLVARATEKVVGDTYDAKIDTKAIEKALKTQTKGAK